MTVSLELVPLIALIGAVLGVVDSVLRVRRHGQGSVLALLALPIALLLLVAATPSLQQFVTTTLPIGGLAAALAVLLIVSLIRRSPKAGPLIWLTAAALAANAATVVFAFTDIRP